MASIEEDIQNIRVLRKDIRDPKLSTTTLKAIESIHNCIMSGSDQNGWKKVEWRSSGQSSGHSSGQSSGRSGQHSSKNGAFHNRGVALPVTEARPFGNRPRTDNHSAIPPIDGTDVRRHDNTMDGFRPPSSQKYVSKFKKTAGKVEDTILNTILLGKLNKFSEPNYNEIKEFITHIIDSGQTDMMKCFMNIVFEKAATEEIFCPLYARLLSELSTRYPILLTEMENLFSEYMKIFEEIVDANDAQGQETYNELCKRNVEKKYRRGYSQFLAELIKYDSIDVSTFMKTITTIMTQIELNKSLFESVKLNEEFADCLMKIMKAITTNPPQNNTDNHIYQIRTILKNDMVSRIQPFTLRQSDYVGMSNKARFTFLDIYESIQRF